MVFALVVVILLFLLLLNARATYEIVQDDFSSRGQRISQIIIVWAIPLLGALLTLYFKRQQPEPASGRYRKEPDAVDDFGFSGRSHRQTKERLEEETSSADGGASD